MPIQEELTSELISHLYDVEASWAVDIQISQMSKNMLDPHSIWVDGKFMGIGK